MGEQSNPPPFLHFHQNKLVGEAADGSYDTSQNGISVTQIRKLLGHVGKPIDIFKIDIEGSEYEVLKTYIGGGCPLNANMILLETHELDSANHYSELFTNLRDNCKMELYMKEPNIIAPKAGHLIEWQVAFLF